MMRLSIIARPDIFTDGYAVTQGTLTNFVERVWNADKNNFMAKPESQERLCIWAGFGIGFDCI